MRLGQLPHADLRGAAPPGEPDPLGAQPRRHGAPGVRGGGGVAGAREPGQLPRHRDKRLRLLRGAHRALDSREAGRHGHRQGGAPRVRRAAPHRLRLHRAGQRPARELGRRASRPALLLRDRQPALHRLLQPHGRAEGGPRGDLRQGRRRARLRGLLVQEGRRLHARHIRPLRLRLHQLHLPGPAGGAPVAAALRRRGAHRLRAPHLRMELRGHRRGPRARGDRGVLARGRGRPQAALRRRRLPAGGPHQRLPGPRCRCLR